MNRDLTILLLLKDASPFTWRWMRYYNETGLPFKVILADGGKDKSMEKLSDKSLFPNVNYEYIRYPYDKNVATFFKKICDALGKIETEYVLLGSNDDFYLTDSLVESVKFLNENQDYVLARDDIYSFEIKVADGGSQAEKTHGKIVSLAKLYTDKSNEGDLALGRIRTASEYSNSLWHDICRTDVLRESYKILYDSGIIDLDLSDRLINYLLVVNGKVHHSEGLHMLHQSRKSGLGNVLGKRDVFEWIMSPEWPKDVSKIFDIIAQKTSEKDGVAVIEAHYKIMQSYLCFIIGKKMIKEKVERDFVNRPGKIFLLSHIVSKDNIGRKLLKNLYLSMKSWRQDIKNKRVIQNSPYYKKIKLVEDFLIRSVK